MIRFFRVWGPTLLGVSFATLGGMLTRACAIYDLPILLIPSVVLTGVSIVAVFVDVIAFHVPNGPSRRAMAAGCSDCAKLREQYQKVWNEKVAISLALDRANGVILELEPPK